MAGVKCVLNYQLPSNHQRDGTWSFDHRNAAARAGPSSRMSRFCHLQLQPARGRRSQLLLLRDTSHSSKGHSATPALKPH
ncbi:hypothetical protein KC328_g73 [Hortaea werneckii]|nr:hypothetical protein KC328_g73 [Hortaea werneckii]